MVARIPIAVAALVRDGLVLLVHRHPLRQWYPDCWDLVGGHVEPGESPREAVIRECFEELGVQAHDPVPIPMKFNDPTLDVHADIRWFCPTDLSGLKLADPAALSSIRSAVQLATD